MMLHRTHNTISFITLLFFSLFNVLTAYANTPPQAAIATAHPLATAAGQEILQAGGNAFDAAVAITATLGVVEPYGSGLGGGGFWLLHRQSDGHQVVIDGREKAPAKATRDMYLDADGNVIAGASIDGPLAAGIPGVPAAMVHIAQKYGQLPLAKSLAPAVRLAKTGFKIDKHYRRYAKIRLKTLRRFPSAANIFLQNNEVPELAYRLKQPDLARTLETLARQGKAGFYEGALAQKLVNGVSRAGGIWTLNDLKNYKIIEREPVISEYRGMRIISVPPPSSGGIALAEMFNMLAQVKYQKMGLADKTHFAIEIMRRAYRDRAEYLGDSDYVGVPISRLTGNAYARTLIQDIDRDQATPSDALKAIANPTGDGADTTHFSILDKQGNRVSATLSVNYLFGSAYVVPGTGFLLNDEMDDFSSKPGMPNTYGLIGAEANAIAPGKRPLSSMSPTFIENERGIAILGTPGGSRIITMVLLAALEYLNGGDADAIVQRPRFHHQYMPDWVMYENDALSESVVSQLSLRGHKLKKLTLRYGNMQAVVWDKLKVLVTAASDPRGIGSAKVIK